VLTFEWDEVKNAANVLKHGISFEQASEIFLDPLSLTIQDPEHSDVENRFVTIGTTLVGMIVVAIHVDREGRVRMISARLATPKERRDYEST
jgi:uncharacterized protein